MLMTEYGATAFIGLDDVRQGALRLTIANVELGSFGKPVVTFTNGDRFSLNKTNVRTLIDAFGEDSRDWTGCEIEAYAGQINYQGQQTASVLVRPVSPGKPLVDEMDNEISF
jgi:hypothetical protein